jgi:hypothetical protein
LTNAPGGTRIDRQRHAFVPWSQPGNGTLRGSTVTTTECCRTHPSNAEVHAALERVIADPLFAASPQLVSFLRFVVESTLAGAADRIKEYSIALGALGRQPAFNPREDPIVRVEATRLRRALERYYAGPGRDDRIVIELPRGTYVPIFIRRGPMPDQEAFVRPRERFVPNCVRRKWRLAVFVICISAIVSLTMDAALVLIYRAL